MSPEELKKLQDSLQKGISDGVASLEKKVGEEQTKAQAEVKKLQDELKAVSEKLAKLEAAPVGKAPAIVTSTKYRGYNIEKQGGCFRNHEGKGKFETLNTGEKINEYSKFMLDVIGHLHHKDVDATASLKEYYAKASLAGSSAAVGGALVPDEFAMDLVSLGRDRTFALRRCTVINMGTDTTYVPAELTLASLNWKSESSGTQMAQGDPTFEQVTLTTQQLTGYAISTNALLADATIDVVGILSEQFGYGTALELDNQVLNGTGSPVSGVLTAKAGYSTVMTTGLSNFSSISCDNLISLMNQISEGYSYAGSGPIFVFNKNILNFLRSVKSTTNEYVLQQPASGAPSTLWGVPYETSSKATATTGASTAFVSYGNFKYFYIGRRSGAMTIDIDPYGRFDYNETRFRMVTRWALAPAKVAAFARLITAS